jgi:hypothetical protein
MVSKLIISSAYINARRRKKYKYNRLKAIHKTGKHGKLRGCCREGIRYHEDLIIAQYAECDSGAMREEGLCIECGHISRGSGCKNSKRFSGRKEALFLVSAYPFVLMKIKGGEVLVYGWDIIYEEDEKDTNLSSALPHRKN